MRKAAATRPGLAVSAPAPTNPPVERPGWRDHSFFAGAGDIRYRSVQSAYSSQQCSACGFTLKENRQSQAKFACLFCGYRVSADVNAAANLAERFGDEELNQLHFRAVMGVLVQRFLHAHPQTWEVPRYAGRSPTSRLDAESACTTPSVMQPLSLVKAGNSFLSSQ